jgi:hypothetical protein
MSEGEKTHWTVVGTVKDTPLAKAQAISREIGEQGLVSARIASSGGRVGSMGSMSSIGGMGGGTGALPGALASSSPLSVFQYVLSRSDRLALYRYFIYTDPFVGRAIDLHTELPMSRLTISPPKGPNVKQNKEINRIYENMSDRVELLEVLLEIAREYWSVGDVYIWHEWDEEIQEWANIYVLPCEYCNTIISPFSRSDEVIIFARPLVDTTAMRRLTNRDLYAVAGDPEIDDAIEEVEDELPEELRELLDYGEGKPLNTDPKKGSYCHHMARNRSPNEPYGKALLERCLETLFRSENLKNAQIQISGRNMQPKHLIWAEGISKPELDDLRAQVDLSLLENADFPIVTNFQVNWEIKGANDRLLQVETEYNTLREDLAVGLATTKDMLTGASTYSGNRITQEMMNTQYLSFREIMKKYVEKCIFRPVAEAKGHYYYEEIDTWIKTNVDDLKPGDDVIQEYDGTLRKRKVQTNKIYNHSQLRFNRLSVRDNAEVYDQLFQLHQKGSLGLKYLLDLHNIDPDENSATLLEDMATVKDPNFNTLIQGIYQAVAERVVGETDILQRIIKGMNLDAASKTTGEPTPGAEVTGGAPGIIPTDSSGAGFSGEGPGDTNLEESDLEMPGGEMGGMDAGGDQSLPGDAAPVTAPPPGPAASVTASSERLLGKRLSSVEITALQAKAREEKGKTDGRNLQRRTRSKRGVSRKRSSANSVG